MDRSHLVKKPIVDKTGKRTHVWVKMAERKNKTKEAYHGTFRKFEKFDTNFIGDGSGGAAFGYGVYVTDLQDVAEEYTSFSIAAKYHKFLISKPELTGDITPVSYKVELPENFKSIDAGKRLSSSEVTKIAIKAAAHGATNTSINMLRNERQLEFVARNKAYTKALIDLGYDAISYSTRRDVGGVYREEKGSDAGKSYCFFDADKVRIVAKKDVDFSVPIKKLFDSDYIEVGGVPNHGIKEGDSFEEIMQKVEKLKYELTQFNYSKITAFLKHIYKK